MIHIAKKTAHHRRAGDWRISRGAGLTGKIIRGVGYVLIVALGWGEPAEAQAETNCSQEALAKLDQAIEEHNEHTYRLETKFKDIWYPRGPIPELVRRGVTRQDMEAYLKGLGARRAALLFYGLGFTGDKLHTWLMTDRGKIICGTPRTLVGEDKEVLQIQDENALRLHEWSWLGTRGTKNPRTATVLTPHHDGPAGHLAMWNSTLKSLAKILLPDEVVQEFERQDSDGSKIDTLVIVPITVIPAIASGNKAVDSATQASEKHSPLSDQAIHGVLSIGVVPFGALPVGEKTLIEKMSVIIAPGFSAFTGGREAVRNVRKGYGDPIVIGNPTRPKDPKNPTQPGYQDLPGAEEEARQVAERLGTTAFVKKTATKQKLERYLKRHPETVDFIHLATHGIADAKDPVDKSFLVFSDGDWNAREISQLRRKEKGVEVPLLQAKPLVVMSACQTALGKDFPAGTIGLARAWHWAGASNVVMSLWSVDDESTRELMGQFVEGVIKGQAVDKALQAAMLQLRGKYPSPSHWASFAVYGAPERLEKE